MRANHFLTSKGIKSVRDLRNAFQIQEWLKEYALEIASEAFDAGFAHSNNPNFALNKAEYSQKLHKEL